MKSWLSAFVEPLIPVKEGEEVHSWGTILFILGFIAALSLVWAFLGR